MATRLGLGGAGATLTGSDKWMTLNVMAEAHPDDSYGQEPPPFFGFVSSAGSLFSC